MRKFSATSPKGRPKLTFSFRKMLPEGVTVTSAELFCVVRPESVASDPSPSARLDGAYTIADGKYVQQFVKDGIHNVDYIVSALGTYSDGQREQIDAVLEVRNYNEVGV